MKNSNQFQSLTLIYYAMLGGQIIFGAVVYFLLENKLLELEDTGLGTVFLILVPLVIIGCYLLSTYLFKLQLASIPKEGTLSQKFEHYRNASIIRYALLEGASMLAGVAYLLTADLTFLGLLSLVILIFILIKPSKEKVAEALELDQSEISKL